MTTWVRMYSEFIFLVKQKIWPQRRWGLINFFWRDTRLGCGCQGFKPQQQKKQSQRSLYFSVNFPVLDFKTIVSEAYISSSTTTTEWSTPGAIPTTFLFLNGNNSNGSVWFTVEPVPKRPLSPALLSRKIGEVEKGGGLLWSYLPNLIRKQTIFCLSSMRKWTHRRLQSSRCQPLTD